MIRAARVVPALLAIACTVAPAARASADTDNPVERARRSAENLNYSGQMEIHWVDQWGSAQLVSFHVWGGDGVVQLGDEDRSRLAATDGLGFAAHDKHPIGDHVRDIHQSDRRQRRLSAGQWRADDFLLGQAGGPRKTPNTRKEGDQN